MQYRAITPNSEEMESSTTGKNTQKYFTIPNSFTQTFWTVEEVLDGDSLVVKQELTKESKEIRLYGLDAPEVHLSRKMREDEAKSGIPASLLLQYGLMSLDFVLQVAQPGTRVTIITELHNRTDFWLRDLVYVILPSGECLNELLISNGWAKVSHSYNCVYLHYFQQISIFAKMQKKGIHAFTDAF